MVKPKENPQAGSEPAQGAREHTIHSSEPSAASGDGQGLAELYEIAERRIFVPYRLVPKGNGKTDKVPSNGQHNLSYTEASCLMPLVAALALVNEWRGLHGVGLVFEDGIVHDDWQLIGLDYDGVDFGRFELPVASYAERSPSGNGIHQLAWVPTAWAERFRYTTDIQLAGCHHAEVYLASRFLTVTGNRINAESIARLDDKALAELESWGLNSAETAEHAAAPEIGEGTPINLGRSNLTAEQQRLIAGELETGKRSEVWHGLLIRLLENGEGPADLLATVLGTAGLWAFCMDHRNDNAGRALDFAKDEIGRAYDKSLTKQRERLVGLNPAWKPEPKPSAVPFPQPFPGPMVDAVAAGLEVAHKQQPELTTMAALSSMAAACGSFYRQRDGSRLNLYFLGIARTGTGKDLPLRLAKQIGRLGNAKLIGAPGSGQGLEDTLASNTATYCVVDEIAHFFSVMNDAKASGYERANARKLLELFSAASDNYETRALAGKETRIIQHPAFNLVGFTTPEKLGSAFNPDDFADGLAGRILFVFTDNNPPARRVRKPIDLPVSVKRTAMQVEMGLHYLHSMGGIVIDIADDADAALDALLTEFDQRGKSIDSPWESALCVRSLEKVERIAGVLAVWDNPAKPVITTGHVGWAAQFVRASNTAVLGFVDEYMHGGEEQENAAKLIRMIRDGKTKPSSKSEIAATKAGWVPRSALLRRAKMGADKEFEPAIRLLIKRGEIVEGKVGDLLVLGVKGDE